MQIDNIKYRLVDELKQNIQKGSKLSIAAASFSIYAYEALQKELDKIEELRFVFTSPTFLEENFKKDKRAFYIPHIYNEMDLCGGEFELRLKNRLNQRAIAKECSKWVQKKVQFRSNTHKGNYINGLIQLENKEHTAKSCAYVNVSSFTTADLGLSPKKGWPTLIQKIDFPESNAYLEWFDEVWENPNHLEDVTEKVQAYFESAYQENSPEFIYFITLYA